MFTIYHNPRCRKSREALALLENTGKEIEIRQYLKSPLSIDELKQLLSKLQLRPMEIIRKSESIFKDQFKGKELTDDEWIAILARHPILIERPIVVKGQHAVIGRPIENISGLL
jgi:arsenate reductase